MQPQAAVTEFIYAHDYSDKSRVWYDRMLAIFAAYCEAEGVSDISEVSAPLVRKFLDTVRLKVNPRSKQPVGTHTVHAYARAVRALLNWGVREDLVNPAVTRRLVMPKREIKTIQVFSNDHVLRLMRACERSPLPARDRTMLALLLDTGMRANELCTLTTENVHLGQEAAWLLLHGKGNKWREVGLGLKSRGLLHRYIHRERHAPPDQPRVFLGRRGPISPSGVDQIIYTLRDIAGPSYFTGVRVSAHTFRHTFAFNYLKNGGDLYKLSRLLGHTSVVVTEGYLRAFTSHEARNGGISVLDNLNQRN